MDAAVNSTVAAVASNATDQTTNVDLSYRVRATFYALSLDETFIEHPKNVPNIVLETVPIMVIMTLLELIVLRSRGMGDRFRLHNAAINFATGVLNEAARVFIFRGAEFAAYIWVYNNLRITELSWNSPWTYFFAILSVDFCNYWWHRCCHELSFMWAAHYVHHSSEDLNASVGARISVTMRPFKWMYFIPLAVVGLPPSTFLVHSQLGFVWAFWVHNEAWPKTQKIIPVFGHIIEFVMSTPSHHRVHHAVNKYCIDKNYGTTLIIWDRLFGTFVEEREDEELTYGTISQKDNNHIVGLQADPWRDLWGRICSVDSLFDKIKTIFYGPGWVKGKPRLGDLDDLPERIVRKKHQYDAPWWINLYLSLHCLFVLIMYFDAGGRVVHLSQAVRLISLVYIFVSYAGLGGLYTTHLGSMWIEPVRLLVSVPMFLLLPIFASERLAMAMTTINLLSLLLWPALRSQVLSQGKKVE
ncbi:alkylglycerol monooxygenase-like [Eriocheir sinensis]|uniref:alkylglycerol monooxygenase-like n=1 Tax=Eriocheir sinensis TaxID=95602 RepID=UPI0021C96216|nr:alkylglycerol monooxygenase-like [Eriocheir sinensis]